jgi:hypothetical protein
MGVGIPTRGSVAISMTMTGVMTVAMPLIAEFPVHPGDRRSSSCPHPRRRARGRKNAVGRAPGAGIRRDSRDSRALIVGLGSPPPHGAPGNVLHDRVPGRAIFGGGWPHPRMQRGPNANRIDLQHSARADDHVRLRVLPVEGARKLPDIAETGAAESAGVCERRAARHARTAVSAYRAPIIVDVLAVIDVVLMVVAMQRFRSKAVG